MNILQNRKADNLRARMAEFFDFSSLDTVQDIINRAFEAGVAAKSDADFATMQDALDRARARYEAQRNTQPIAFLDVEPGTLIKLAVHEL
jgi:flagellar basal body P-ring protein FlgI